MKFGAGNVCKKKCQAGVTTLKTVSLSFTILSAQICFCPDFPDFLTDLGVIQDILALRLVRIYTL